MDHKEFFLKHWNQEAKATRKVIERVPADKCEYRADPKARTAREIAWLIVREEAVLADGLAKGALEWTEVAAPAAMSDVLAEYNRQHDALTKRLREIPVESWEKEVPFLFN